MSKHCERHTDQIACRICLTALSGPDLASIRVRTSVRAAIAAMAFLGVAQVSAAGGRLESLSDMSLQELGEIEITSVSRQPESLADAPASIFVITAEDIRRSGSRTLPEILRLAPNLQVAQSNASGYAVTARGFNNDNGLANKLLVLIDGRTVYSPSLSGVFWDMQDVLIEDIERIEVISGPGATLWGSNAVNGIINVITLAARDTQGALVSLGKGGHSAHAAFRVGGTLGAQGHFRIYGKSDDLAQTRLANGNTALDGWRRAQIGFRADWVSTNQSLMIQGNSYEGRAQGRPPGQTTKVSGTNLLARWGRELGDGSNVELQAYYDYTDRADPIVFRDTERVFDVQFQHGIPIAEHKFLWGAGYRHARSDMPDSVFFGFVPSKRRLTWRNVFAQNETKLTPDLALTIGLKLESNDYTGWEYLPNARLAWKISPNQLLWGSISRAVRAPARLDREIRFPPNGFFINGGPDFVSEVANVIELGYRVQPTSAFTYSVTAFRHNYDKLRSGQLPPFANVQNMIEGSVQGVEAWATIQPLPAWRLSGGFSTLHKDLKVRPGSTDPTGPSALGNDPEYQWVLRSSFNLTDSHEFDVTVRRIGALPSPAVPAYTAVDARLGWRVTRDLEISVKLQNIFDPGHPEFGAAPGRSEFQRGAFVGLSWRI